MKVDNAARTKEEPRRALRLRCHFRMSSAMSLNKSIFRIGNKGKGKGKGKKNIRRNLELNPAFYAFSP
jgi:hypothetical protein